MIVADVEFKSRNVLADPELRTAIKDYRCLVFVLSGYWKMEFCHFFVSLINLTYSSITVRVK
jgi:hypothetical protein